MELNGRLITESHAIMAALEVHRVLTCLVQCIKHAKLDKQVPDNCQTVCSRPGEQLC